MLVTRLVLFIVKYWVLIPDILLYVLYCPYWADNKEFICHQNNVKKTLSTDHKIKTRVNPIFIYEVCKLRISYYKSSKKKLHGEMIIIWLLKECLHVKRYSNTMVLIKKKNKKKQSQWSATRRCMRIMRRLRHYSQPSSRAESCWYALTQV